MSEINRKKLASDLGLAVKNLAYLLYRKKTENCYKSFFIPKKSGGMREINAPNDKLKSVQKRLANLLYLEQEKIWQKNNINPSLSHGFEKGKGIVSNAKIHKNKKYVLNIDLKDFFNSFHFGRVRGYFNKNKNFEYDIKYATMIAQLACYKGTLPQGAPTSPIITNLICQILDVKLLDIAKKYKLNYTRYADDLTFSTNHNEFIERQEKILCEIEKIINKCGFQIKSEKTRVQYKSSKQVVTGLVVNEKINVDSVYYKKVRAMAHSLYNKNTFNINGDEGNIKQLEGMFSFINEIDKYNNLINGEKITRFSLNKREREYQKFIFYKYFIKNEKPIVITEGKTDVLYIKAALQKLYDKYPLLIAKREDGTFEYKIGFLKRTNKLLYFFGFSKDGADSINKIYNYYIGTKGHPNYSQIFDRYGTMSNNPVILIFDNELESDKEKPITKFVGYKKLSEKDKTKFKKDNSIKLTSKGNFYLATNPLVDNKIECQIEDLFEKEIQEIKIGGKSFCSKPNKNLNDKQFGKSEFAKYIFQNYETINFDNFIPMLNNINNIVREYSNMNGK